MILNKPITGYVEILKRGFLVLPRTENTITQYGEDWIANYVEQGVLGNPDTFPFKHIHLGYGCQNAVLDNDKIVFENPPAGATNAGTYASSIFNGKKVKMISGANSGASRDVKANSFAYDATLLKYTIELDRAFDNNIAIGDGFFIEQSNEEKYLLSYNNADVNGVDFTSINDGVKQVSVAQSGNSVTVSATWNAEALTGGSDLEVCELVLGDNSGKGLGNIFSKTTFPVVKFTPGTDYTVNWTFLFGQSR